MSKAFATEVDWYYLHIHIYVQFGPLQQQSDWRTTKTTFLQKALQNEEKSAFKCRNILIHNIEKLYVNKYQSGASPEIEQLRQSALGE